LVGASLPFPPLIFVLGYSYYRASYQSIHVYA
jgi:hypothetical protein